MSDSDEYAAMREADRALWEAVVADPGQPYRLPRRIPDLWNNYQRTGEQKHRLPARFRDKDDPGLAEKPLRVRPRKLTSAECLAAKTKARAMKAEGHSLEAISVAIGLSLPTAKRYANGTGSWGKLV